MTMPLDEYLRLHQGPQPGPCAGCGATGYPISMGGPSICPACDCAPPERRVKQLAEENRLLRQRVAELERERGQTVSLGTVLDGIRNKDLRVPLEGED